MITKALSDYFVQCFNGSLGKAKPGTMWIWKQARLTAECIFAIHYPNAGLDKLKAALDDAEEPKLLLPSDCRFCNNIVIEETGIRVDGLLREMRNTGLSSDDLGLVLCFHISEEECVYFSENAGVVTKDMLGLPIVTNDWFTVTCSNVVLNVYHDSELLHFLSKEMHHFEYVDCSYAPAEPITAAKKETKAKK